MNKKTANILFVGFMIIVLVFMIFVISYMISNKEAFTENPFVYGAKKLNLGNCNCVCYDDIVITPIYLYFNQTSFSS